MGFTPIQTFLPSEGEVVTSSEVGGGLLCFGDEILRLRCALLRMTCGGCAAPRMMWGSGIHPHPNLPPSEGEEGTCIHLRDGTGRLGRCGGGGMPSKGDHPHPFDKLRAGSDLPPSRGKGEEGKGEGVYSVRVRLGLFAALGFDPGEDVADLRK